MKSPPGPDLRNMILALDPGKVRLAPSDDLPHVWGRSGATDSLSSGDDALSPIFNAGNDLLTQLRLATEHRP